MCPPQLAVGWLQVLRFMPTRIIREGIITSEAINSLSPQSELFYRRLMSVADDYGRYYAHPSLLRAACYPLQLDKISDKDVKQMLSECIAVDLLVIYGSGKYLSITKFGQQTRSKSKFPEPTDSELLSKCKSNDKQMLSLVGVGDVCEDVVEVDSRTKPNGFVYPSNFSEAFKSKFADWMACRKKKKSCKDFPKMFQEQLNFLSVYDEYTAIEILSNSIRNDYQGLFEPKIFSLKVNGTHKPNTKEDHAKGF